MDQDSDKRASLSARISQAEAKGAEKESSGFAGRFGFDFVGSVVGAGVLGAIADQVFGTGPWCLLGMVGVGFIVGIVTAWRSLQQSEAQEK